MTLLGYNKKNNKKNNERECWDIENRKSTQTRFGWYLTTLATKLY